MERRMDLAGGGMLSLRQEGNRIHLEAERPWDERGLYKVWIYGARGGRMLLGTMTPEGRGLRLRRTVPLGDLERAGCWPVVRGEAVLAFPFPAQGGWYCERHPEALLADPALRGQISGPMLCRKGQAGFWLAAPFQSSSPVPLTMLFCLARVERVEGRPHLIWEFDRQGRPKPPHKQGKNG